MPRMVKPSPRLARIAQSVKIWDIATYQCLHTLRGHKKTVWSVCYAPDSKTLASAGGVYVRIWETITYQCLRTLQGHEYGVNSVVFSPDSRTLASASDDRSIKLWNTNTGKCVRTLQGHNGTVWDVCYAPDGKTLASAGEDSLVKIWDTSTGECLKTMTDHDASVHSVRYAPNGKTLASAGADNSVKIWDARNYECLRTLRGEMDLVLSICYAPDMQGSDFLIAGYCKKYASKVFIPAVIVNLIGKYLLHKGSTLAAANGYDGSRNNAVTIWDTNTGQCLDTLRGYAGVVFSICYSPNGQTLASTSGSEIVKMWALEYEKPVRTFSKNDFMHYVKRCFTSRAFKAAELAIGSVLIAKNIKNPSDKPYKSRLFLGVGMVLVTDALCGFFISRRKGM